MITEARKQDLNTFLKSLGLNIKNLELLNTALTHSSYLKAHKGRSLASNERLEFFGDAVLKLYISDYLMNKYSSYTEGELSNLRAYVISEKILSNIAHNLNIKKYLLLGKSEMKAVPVSVIADAMESLLAVIYHECGSETVKKFIFKNWHDYIEKADKNKEKDNFKAILQEYTQASKLGLPIYKTVSEAGPDHKKEFEVAVYLKNVEIGNGKGKTKKDASQNAAKSAIISLKSNKIKLND